MTKISDTKLDALVDWAERNGVDTSNVSISSFITTGRGIGSTKKLYTNECAIRIPLTILITGPKVVQSSKLQKILSSQKDKFNMQECFLLWIGLEKSATEGLFALLTQNSLDTVSP